MPREASPSFVRTTLAFGIPLAGVLNASGAVTFLLSFVVPFKASLERVTFIPEVAGAGAGATQALKVRKGNATGTVLATVTPTLAAHVMGAAGITDTVTAANEEAARFVDGDTLSITKDAGTVFSAAGGTLLLTFRQRPQSRA